jgi:hypothetical protein
MWLFLFAPLGAIAQDPAVSPQIGIDLNFNHTDVMAGVGAGVCFNTLNASAKLTFKGRLGSKRVWVETGTPDVLAQYRERRYLLGIEADKRFRLTEFSEVEQLGLFLGGFGGMTFGDFRGSDTKVPLKLAGSAQAGVYFSNIEIAIFKLGYMYLPLQTRSVVNHRVFFSIDLIIR